MSDKTRLLAAVRGALAVGAAGGLGIGGVALAQTAAPAAATSATQLQKIIVTGSHIPQTSIATAQPVVNISRQQIEASGFTTVGQILTNLVQGGASFGPRANFFIGPQSTGTEGINLKNLGSNRVLVLVDGHRWVPELDGVVNLASIPSAIIQRIQIDLNGASAIYGSDAITGVINIITMKNFNGAEASAYLGGYDGSGDGGGWDGQTEKYDLTIGTSGNRGGVLMSLGFRQFDPVWSTNRYETKYQPYGFLPYSLGNPANNGFWLLQGKTNPNNLRCFGSNLTNDGCMGPGPKLVPIPLPCTVGCRGLPAAYLLDPSQRYYGYAHGHFDLTPNVTFTSTFLFRDESSVQIISPAPLRFGAGGIWHANGLNIGIASTNPGNPFGTDLIPYASFPKSIGGKSTSGLAASWCSKFGTNPAGGCLANSDLLAEYSTEPYGLGKRYAGSEQTTWYWRSGFNGTFMMAGNQWNWDVSGSYAHTREAQTLKGVQNTVKMQQALGPAADCTGDCVPWDIWTGTGGNQITPGVKNFVDTTINSSDSFTQRNITADLAGNFFNGWYAGPWGIAVGAAYLYQAGTYTPDAFTASGNTTSNALEPTGGKISTRAEYAELQVPLASNLFLAKNLSVDLANRWSQFRVNGISGRGAASSSTGRIGFKWQPIESFLLRGSWSQSFREPSIAELFGGQGISFNPVVDPCITGNPKVTTPPPGTFNCPSPSPTANYGQLPTVTGGNAHLTPERAISRSAGFVWSPRFAPGLNVSADFYKIELTNPVGALPEQTLLNGCYLSDDQTFCNLITRVGPHITKVINTSINTGSTKTNGWDVGFSYALPVTPVGQFTVRYNANFILTFNHCFTVTNASGGLTGQCHDQAGSQGYYLPKKRMHLTLDWSFGPWSANWRMDLIGPKWENCAFAGGANALDARYGLPKAAWCSNPNKTTGSRDNFIPGQNHLGTTIYNDLQVSYNLAAWHTTLTFGVNNIFNKNAPVCQTCFRYNSSFYYYRIPGRNFYGRIQVKF